jgi:DNA-3-methyladenine glycosylase II
MFLLRTGKNAFSITVGISEEVKRGRILLTAAKMTLKPIPPFDFELIATIFSHGDSQIRKYEKGRFWQVISVDNKLLLAIVTSTGTVDDPELSVKLESFEKTCKSDKEKAGETICKLFNLNFDLKPFFEQSKTDRVMAHLTRKLRGLKSPTTPTIFEALIDSIVEQQISLKIANKMEERLIKTFGGMLSLDKEVYYAFPTPQKLVSTSVHNLRDCGLSQRKAEYIRDISKMIIDGKLNLEELKDREDANDILTELDEIRGIGTWTAELTMIRGMQKLEAFPADDVGLRRVIAHYYSNDRQISSEEARRIAERWGRWKGLAGFYLIVAAATHVNIS